MKFQIDGIWYEAETYAQARKMHQDGKGGGITTSQTSSLPKPVFTLPKPSLPMPSLPMPSLPMPTLAMPSLPQPVPTGVQAADMICYRGEKNNWWSPPQKRLICGMTVFEPWNLKPGIKTMTDLWNHLRQFITQTSFGKVDGFAQHLRASGRPYALATARTGVGSFTSDFNYVIRIPNARTFRWGPKLTLGEPANFVDTRDIDADYIVLNADRISDSTVLAFGHKCGTYEVTFLHDMPLQFVESCNGTRVDQLKPPILSRDGLSFTEKIELRKYLR